MSVLLAIFVYLTIEVPISKLSKIYLGNVFKNYDIDILGDAKTDINSNMLTSQINKKTT